MAACVSRCAGPGSANSLAADIQIVSHEEAERFVNAKPGVFPDPQYCSTLHKVRFPSIRCAITGPSQIIDCRRAVRDISPVLVDAKDHEGSRFSTPVATRGAAHAT